MIVPSVIEENGIKRDTALFVQLVTKHVDSVDCARLIVGSEITEIVPGVVVKERSIRVRSLALDVCEKRSTHLPGRRDSDYGRVCN
jgi:hypothetical protein